MYSLYTMYKYAQTEIELKFGIPKYRLIEITKALRGDVRGEPPHTQQLQAIYYDTTDERLAAHGLAIRLRKEGRYWIQTAKAATQSNVVRLEHNVVVSRAKRQKYPQLDIALHDGFPIGAALRHALDGNENLIERFRIDVIRTSRISNCGDSCVELALDIGAIVANYRTLPICEFELELKSGSIADLVMLADIWSSRYSLWLTNASKFQRGLQLVHGVSETCPVYSVGLRVGKSSGTVEFLTTTVESCLAQVIGNASNLAAGSRDEELVHQLRVGLRRLRTALTKLKDFADNIEPQWEAQLANVFKELGAQRDVTSVIPTVLKEMKSAGVTIRAEVKPIQALRSPNDIVVDPSFQSCLLSILGFCHSANVTAVVSKHQDESLKRRLARILNKLHIYLVRNCKHFTKLSPERQHGVRKQLKSLRYLSEFSAAVFGQKRVYRYLKNWSDAQNAIGLLNDHRIGIEAVRAATPLGSSSAVERDWFVKTINRSIKGCKKPLRNSIKQPVFWKK